MSKRSIPIAFFLLAVAAAVIIGILLGRSGPPQAARLLPGADGFVYLNLRPLRLAGILKDAAPVALDPDYAQFVRDTGIQFERDLDEAAFAVHLPSPLNNGQGETRYSEVFVGRFDAAKLAGYLRRLTSNIESYRGLNIYVIPLPGRTVRVVLLGRGVVAASNTEAPYVLQGIIDRHKDLAPLRGPELLRHFYRHVPLGSLAWAVMRLAPAGAPRNQLYVLPGGFDLFVPPETTVVASLRYLGSVQLQAGAYCANEGDARRLADQLKAFVALVRAVEMGAQNAPDADVRAFFESLSVSQEKERTDVTATIPPGFFKKVFSESPAVPSLGPQQAAPKVAPKKPGKKKTAR